MKKVYLLLALLLGLVLPCVSQTDTLLNEIRPKLQDKLLTLHNFYKSNELHFNSQGDLSSSSPVGDWTVWGRLNVETLTMSERSLRIGGKRVWVRFTGKRGEAQSNNPSGPDFTMEIDLREGADKREDLNRALERIFVLPPQQLAEYVPEYWKPYFLGKKSSGSRTVSPTAVLASDSARGSNCAEASNSGIRPGSMAASPVYPVEARAVKAEGSVILHAVISREGCPQDIYIVRPAGMGLDEAAVAAIKNWKYKPYIHDGEAVEVDTEITVNFKLDRN